MPTKVDEKIGESKALAVVPKAELDKIYSSGKVSPDVRGVFRRSLDKDLYSTQGMNIEKFIETNRRIKIEMKEYLDNYKVQRSLMAEVIYYLRNPKLAPVRFVDRVGGFLGKNLQLEAKKIAGDPQAIGRLFEEMALSIEQSRGKTLELEKQAIALYNSSLVQRENVEKDITAILQNISVNKDTIIKLEDDYNKVKTNMDKLLNYMQEKLGFQIKGEVPLLEDESGRGGVGGVEEIGSYENRIEQLLKDDAEKKDAQPGIQETQIDVVDTRIQDKKKLEAIKVYHSINNELAKAENLLRDAKNDKLVLHQNYEKAKENLILYDKVLINQVNEARNYFVLLFAIYDAEVKYTLPTARLIAHLASLQEIAVQLTQQIFQSREIFNSLLDSVTQGALEIQDNIINLAINPSWDPEKIDQAEIRSIELARRTKEFALEMDKRLVEIEAIYKDPAVQLKFKEKPALDSGIQDEYLQKLLSE